MRLDLLLMNDGLLRLGFELLIGSNQEDLKQYIERTYTYARQHGCTIWVINFAVKEEDVRSELALPITAEHSLVGSMHLRQGTVTRL